MKIEEKEQTTNDKHQTSNVNAEGRLLDINIHDASHSQPTPRLSVLFAAGLGDRDANELVQSTPLGEKKNIQVRRDKRQTSNVNAEGRLLDI